MPFNLIIEEWLNENNTFVSHLPLLLKKWYLIIYLLFILAALLITLTTIQHVTEDDNHFNIGVVDKDQSSETKLILNSIGKGSNLGKNVSIKAYDDKQAHTLLKNINFKAILFLIKV